MGFPRQEYRIGFLFPSPKHLPDSGIKPTSPVWNEVKVAHLCLTLCSPWNSPGQNTGVGNLSLLQGNLPNPGIKPRSPTLQADSLPAELLGKSKNTGVGSLSLPRGIFLTQESNWGLLHCRQILHQLSYERSHLLHWQVDSFTTEPPNTIYSNPYLMWLQKPSTWHNALEDYGGIIFSLWGFPGGSDSEETAGDAGDPGLISGLGRSPGRGHGTPVFLPGESLVHDPCFFNQAHCWAKPILFLECCYLRSHNTSRWSDWILFDQICGYPWSGTAGDGIMWLLCHCLSQTCALWDTCLAFVLVFAVSLAQLSSDERLLLASTSFFTPGQLLQVFSHPANTAVTCWKQQQLWARIRLSVNEQSWLASSGWWVIWGQVLGAVIYAGVLWVTMVGCAPGLLLAWCESGLPAHLDRPVKELLSNWTRKRNAIYCGPKLMQQDLWFHPNMQNANRKRNSRCYKNTCHEQAFVPDALQILPLIFTVTLKPEYYYL